MGLPILVLLNPNTYVIGQILQQNWQAQNNGPAYNQISWVYTKFEAGQDVPGPYVISCYNPPGPVTSEMLSPEVTQILEDVVVDILVAVSSGTAGALQARESMRNQVYNILVDNAIQNLAGLTDLWPLRESAKLESPQLIRVAIIFRCRTFFFGP
jgi:hypothetical protein